MGTIVIIGVTGAQGSAVAKTFLNEPGWRVRGITRDPSSLMAAALSGQGVELFQGDLDQVESLLPAMAGATVVFSNTDYFAHLWRGAAEPSILKGCSPNEYAYNKEVQQGVNIAAAADHFTVRETLKHFVYSWLSETRKWSNGKYMQNLHNDAKAETVEQIRSKFPRVMERLSLVEVGQYVTNWKALPPLRPVKQTDGSYVFSSPLSANFVVPFVWPHKDTGNFVKALIKMPAGTLLAGVSERLTWKRWAEIWSTVLKVDATYVQADVDDWFAGSGAPDAFVSEFKEAYAYIAEFGYDGGNPDCLRIDQLPFEVSTTTVEEYIRSEDWSSVL